MARAFVAFLVAGMFSLTGYYAYATFGNKDYSPTAVISAERPSCCQAKLNAKKSCCSESGECTGKCHETPDADTSCCEHKTGSCCEKKD
jgi:hypothetical protein